MSKNSQVAIAAVTRLSDAGSRTDQDLVAVESPLTLTVSHPALSAIRTLGVLMRTPGSDQDLVLGLLHAEGVVKTFEDVEAVDVRGGDELTDTGDAVHVTLASSVDRDDLPGERPLLATSACGLCGRLSIQSLDRVRGRSASAPPFTVDALARLPALLRDGQTVFAETGGLHAAALFDASGNRVALAEDVGRHNAVDKVIGAAFRTGRLPATGNVLVVSGRVAFEIVQKAALAGAAAIVAVGAPSNLAIDAARAAGLTLIGFARNGHFNVYAGSERVR